MPRAKVKQHFRPMDRDFELLRDLFHCRLLTIQTAAKLYFRGSEEAARKRLTTLCKTGYIRCRPGKFNEENIYIFTKAGFDFLRENGQLGRYSKMTWTEKMTQRARVQGNCLKHEIKVMTVRAALEPAIKARKEFRVVEFGTWPRLYQFKVNRTRIDPQRYPVETIEQYNPDGFLRIHEYDNPDDPANHDHYDLFLEVDRSSEDHGRLVDKATAYRAYYASGRFAEEYGYAGARKEEFPFRVLFVLESAERSNNFCERLLQQDQPIMTQVWLAVEEQLMADPLGPIWIRPHDYLRVTADTPYDPIKRQRTNIYVRDPERERFVGKSVRKWGLFETPRY